MQAVTSTFLDAVGAVQQSPVTTVEVDWARDGFGGPGTIDELTTVVSAVRVSRSITSDLPLSVRLFGGSQTAAASFTVHANPTILAQHGAGFLSPFASPSPTGSLPHVGAPARVRQGYRTPAGVELVTVFTGTVRSIRCDAAGLLAEVSCLDGTESLRRPVGLPFIVANDLAPTGGLKPGLDGQWVVDHVLRRCGVYATPPSRGSLSATFHGSAYPSTGDLTSAARGAGPCLFDAPAGFPCEAMLGDATASVATFSRQSFVSTVTSAKFSGRWRVDGQSGVVPILATAGATAGGTPKYRLAVTLAGQLRFDILQVGTTYTSVVGPVVSGWNPAGTAGTVGTPHYIGVHVALTSTSAVVTFRVDGVSTTSASVPLAVNPIGSSLFFTTVGTTHSRVSDFMFEEPSPDPTVWDDAFVPTAVLQPSLLPLTATPVTSAVPAIDTIKAVSEAEFASYGFDELGAFRWFNRTRFATEAPSTSVQRALTSASLTGVSSEAAVDTVRNRVKIGAVPARILAPTYVFALAEVLAVPASGSLTIPVALGSPAINISTAFRVQPSAGVGQSAYRANTLQDGAGTQVTNLTFNTTVISPDFIRLVVTNPNAFAVWLVNPTGVPSSQGSPALAMWGTPVVFGESSGSGSGEFMTQGSTSALEVSVSDQPSIDTYGEQLLDLGTSPWRQTLAGAEATASYLLARLAVPRPYLTGVGAIPNPATQPGDRVTVTDTSALGTTGDWHVVGVSLDGSPAGIGQTFDLRRA